MKISDRLLNIEYALVQAFCWMGFCVCMSFAAVFLQGRGYSNSALGLILAIGNISGFLIAPNLASMVDKSGGTTVFHCLWALIGVQLILLFSFTRLGSASLGLSVLYCLYIAFNAVVNTMNTQLSFALGGWSGRINYSAARGCGSLAYSAVALAIGVLVQRLGANVLPLIGIGFTLLQCLMLAVLTLQSRGSSAENFDTLAEKEQARSLGVFIRENPRFCRLLIGMGLIFFSHNLANNFLINIVRNVGGDAGVMGGLNGFAAFMEIPFMLLYVVIARKIRCASILRFSVIMFTVKALCMALAPSVPWLFATQLLQGLSYALLTPASVQYTSLVVGPRDSTKGQALTYGMTTLGSALAGGLGGMLYDSMAVRSVLLIGAGISALGAAVCEMGVDGKRA